MNKIFIGTSGWMYKDWGKKFYPKDMKRGFLSFLANEFNTVEINSSFYRTPTFSTFEKWRSETPDDFVFSVKMSRYVTHMKQLLSPGDTLEYFLNNASSLDKKFGVALIQLPPSLKFDIKRLKDFMAELRLKTKELKIKAKFALEPRHKSWMENSAIVRRELKKEKIGLVFPHSAKIPSFPPEDENILTDFVYIRFHGPSEFAASKYGASRLKPWAEKIKRWARQGKTVFAYFNNDANGHAVDDARTLKKLAGIN